MTFAAAQKAGTAVPRGTGRPGLTRPLALGWITSGIRFLR
jgi:hypothetical protein